MKQKTDKTRYFNKKLGEVLKTFRRTKLNCTAAKLADDYNFDKSNLNRMENGVIDSRISNVWLVAEAIGVKLSDVIKALEKDLGPDFRLGKRSGDK